MVVKDLLGEDPSIDLEMPRLPHNLPKVILTEDEVAKLLGGADLRSPVGVRDRAVLELLYGIAIRTGELIALKLSHVDFNERIVYIKQGKGGKEGSVPAPVQTLKWVRRYLEEVRPRFVRKGVDDQTLFLTHTGACMDRGAVCLSVHRCRKRAGLIRHVTPKSLRIALASHLHAHEMNPRHIHLILRHEKLSTVTEYARTTLTGMSKAFRKRHPREKRSSR